MSLDETTLLARLNDGRNIHRTRVTRSTLPMSMDRKQKRDAKNRRHRRNERRREFLRLLKRSPELCRWLGDRLEATKLGFEKWTWF